MAEPFDPSLVDFDFEALLASIPPDFDFGLDGVLTNMPPVDCTKSQEDHLSLELPVIVDPPQEPATVGAKSQDCFFLEPEFPEVVESTVDSAGSGSPHGSDSTWAEELERFLLDDDEEDDDKGDWTSYTDDGFFLDEFFSDAAVQVSADESAKQMDSDGERAAAVLDPAAPASCASASSEPNRDAAPQGESSKILPEWRRGEDNEDPLEKKRRRQLRNRDSAMKSRERRKLYIQDVEKRSRSLEMECRRLEHLLYSAAAENRTLHQHLQRDRTIGSSSAKQESAVLFVELLLLGSLSWLANVVVLFLAPNLLAQNLKLVEVAKGARELERKPILEGLTGAKRPGSRRKCRAWRTKMKMLLALSVT